MSYAMQLSEGAHLGVTFSVYKPKAPEPHIGTADGTAFTKIPWVESCYHSGLHTVCIRTPGGEFYVVDQASLDPTAFNGPRTVAEALRAHEQEEDHTFHFDRGPFATREEALDVMVVDIVAERMEA